MKLLIFFSLAALCIRADSGSLLSKISNTLGYKIHQQLLDEKGNILFSPISVLTAMAMVAGGAGGETSKKIQSVLDSYNMKQEDAHEAIRDFIRQLDTSLEKSYTLDLANSVWLQNGYSILPSYRDFLQSYYFTSAKQSDFARSGDEAREEINKWVESKTGGQIKDFLSRNLDPTTKLFIISAIYFKGIWQTQFNPKETTNKEFKGISDNPHIKTYVPMMHLLTKVPFVSTSDFTAIELPYRGKDVSMVIILPREGKDIRFQEKHLTPTILHQIIPQFRMTKVDILLPKFKISYSANLRDVLMNTGIRVLLDSAADLSGISGRNDLAIKEITHQAVLEVNEEGSEASGVTGVKIVPTMLETNYDFHVQRPFLFYIVDKRNSLNLFEGRIEKLG